MNPFDWKYLGEGGMHILFVYDPPKTYNLRVGDAKLWKGKVLRIRKCDLFSALFKSHRSYSRQYKSIKSRKFNIEEEKIINKNLYNFKIFQSRLRPFLDAAEMILVEISFILKLYQNAINDNCIPLRRRKYPDNISNDEISTIPLSRKKLNVLLIDDYRRIKSSSSSISIEIKPKAGYITSSPLVHPLNRAKYSFTRFEIFQMLQYRGYFKKGWNHYSKIETKSLYNPVNIFSGNYTKIKRALLQLFLCPQNNLKVTYINEDENVSSVIYGHGIIPTKRNTFHQKALEKMLHIHEKSTFKGFHNTLSHQLQRITAFILEKEVFLSRLLEFQTLDFIDGDGAILIYQHLLKLCNGSQENADRLLDEIYSIKSSKDISNKYSQISASPYYDANISDNVFELMELSFIIRSLIQNDCHLEKYHPNFFDVYYDKANCLIHDLSICDCQFLLQNWLLSLAMCDVSIFITICSSKDHSSSYLHLKKKNHAVNEFSPEDFIFGKKQSLNCPGSIIYYGRELLYQVKVIDYDRKPGSKIRERLSKEQLINHFRI